jgi:hypothetical protein
MSPSQMAISFLALTPLKCEFLHVMSGKQKQTRRLVVCTCMPSFSFSLELNNMASLRAEGASYQLYPLIRLWEDI